MLLGGIFLLFCICIAVDEGGYRDEDMANVRVRPASPGPDFIDRADEVRVWLLWLDRISLDVVAGRASGLPPRKVCARVRERWGLAMRTYTVRRTWKRAMADIAARLNAGGNRRSSAA